ncbi:MAG: class I SAM-dependent methyltransferase [Candidatus Thorarchaeota archaeon]
MKNPINVLEYLDGRHYDRKMESRKRQEDIPFYLQKAFEYGSPILELACGTGRITIPIARKGLSIIGLDLLNSMLKEAKLKSKEEELEIEWIEADMTNFDLKKKFNLILMPGCAFNWFLELEWVESCLSSIKKHLEPNAAFIFDAFNPNLNILIREPSKAYLNAKYQDPDGNGEVIVNESNKYDKATQINEVTLSYSIGNKIINNKLILRMFFPQELDAILKYNGFKIIHKYGDFEQTSFTSESRRQIFICHQK